MVTPAPRQAHLQGCEQEIIQAACVDWVHHVPDQVDLGAQVLDSGEHPIPKMVRRGEGAIKAVSCGGRGLDARGVGLLSGPQLPHLS